MSNFEPHFGFLALLSNTGESDGRDVPEDRLVGWLECEICQERRENDLCNRNNQNSTCTIGELGDKRLYVLISICANLKPLDMLAFR